MSTVTPTTFVPFRFSCQMRYQCHIPQALSFLRFIDVSHKKSVFHRNLYISYYFHLEREKEGKRPCKKDWSVLSFCLYFVHILGSIEMGLMKQCFCNEMAARNTQIS